MERRRWWANPQFFLDLEFDNVPPISNENAIANITLVYIISFTLDWTRSNSFSRNVEIVL